MRIVMTTDTYWPRINGVTVAVEGFRRMLTRLGHEVFVCAPEYARSAEYGTPVDDDHVFRFRSLSLPMSPEDRLAWPEARFRITNLLGKLRPDVVHGHSEFTVGFAGKRYCKRTGTPHVMTCHTYWENYVHTYFPVIPLSTASTIAKVWSRSDYRLVDYLTVPSDFLRRLIRSYGVTAPIEILPNGVDPQEFVLDPAEKAEQARRFAEIVPAAVGRPLLLYAGRIAREKNIDFLFDVLRRVIPSVPSVFMLVAGDGPYRAALEKKARQERLEGHIHFAGYLDRKQIAYAYSAADAFVFSSKTETQGLVLVEAMMCRTPVVALRARGTEDFLNGSEGGYLLQENAEIFAGKVIGLLRDNRLREAKREEAWKAAQRWTIERTTGLLLDVYDRAAAVRAAGAGRGRGARRN